MRHDDSSGLDEVDRPSLLDLTVKQVKKKPVLTGVLLLCGLGLLAGSDVLDLRRTRAIVSFITAPVARLTGRLKRQASEELTPELRRKGFNECYPHDPAGLGPYAAYRTIRFGGRLLIPQKGGHTDDMGYDVLVHFHGHEAVRKTLVQVARGVVFVGIDKGLGSGAYSKAFGEPAALKALRDSVTSALVDHTKDKRAHVRHLALSAWSAGYGAVNEILKHETDSVDAVILLDGLHAGWDPSHPRDGTVDSVSGLTIEPVVRFAERALSGEKIFIFTHSEIDPQAYPSTGITADYLIQRFKLQRSSKGLLSSQSLGNGADPRFGLESAVDRGNFHLRGYGGNDELAHCSHVAHIAWAVRDIVEAAWDTPKMDRNVPFLPAPKLGGGETDAGAPISDMPAHGSGN